MYDSFFFFKQKTAYEMRISDWSSDVCSSDLDAHEGKLVDHHHLRDGIGMTSGDHQRHGAAHRMADEGGPFQARRLDVARDLAGDRRRDIALRIEVGRASCRGRVCQYV